jgi:para-aminobenzoate synthetase/4-amino-4-deoxychorismate lyase
VPLRSRLTVEQAVLWLRTDRRPFALVGDWLGGVVVLGSEPARVPGPDSDPFAALDSLPDVTACGEGLVGGGWIGWLGYGLGARIENLPPGPPAPVVLPQFSLAFYDHVVLFDGGQWWFEALWSHERDAALRARLALWESRLETEPPPTGSVELTPFELTGNGAAGHVLAVEDCCRRIAEGELFQANLCLRLQAEFAGDLVDLFARALPRAMPRFGALVDGVLSLSPERFLRREGRRVQTEPIKGTRGRTGTEQEQQAALQALIGSGKDASEHVMIVDLMRNDLGRVCHYGSIEARPPRAERHSGVWHLVSTVSGQLRDGIGDGALLRATFPPGSVTGAPKIQAMKVIAALESTRRELYTGAIAIASPLAGLDMSVVIRTFETRGRKIWFGAGGGIVADSEPELELAEALAKASGPIAAIGGTIAEPSRRRVRAEDLGEAALAHGTRPDPGCGVFETVLVHRGAPMLVQEHLDRLAASLSELYGASLEPDLQARVLAAAGGTTARRARLRILADARGSATISISPETLRRDRPVRLSLFTLPGGLGAHKWRDRRLLEALAARVPGTVPLLVDTDGLVLEAAYANVWIVEHDRLITPPADGRILPGITRASLLAGEPSAAEEPLGLVRLQAAEAIFLTSSIAGRHPAELPFGSKRRRPLSPPRG